MTFVLAGLSVGALLAQANPDLIAGLERGGSLGLLGFVVVWLTRRFNGKVDRLTAAIERLTRVIEREEA